MCGRLKLIMKKKGPTDQNAILQSCRRVAILVLSVGQTRAVVITYFNFSSLYSTIQNDPICIDSGI